MRTNFILNVICFSVTLSFALAPMPAAAQTGGGGGPGQNDNPVRFGQVTTCSEARGWRAFTRKEQFRPGERLGVYAETLGTVHNGQIDLEMTFRVMDPEDDEVFSETMRFTRQTNVTNWAGWNFFPIPADAELGDYTVRVDATDHLTGQMGSASGSFTIASTISMEPDRPQLVKRSRPQPAVQVERTSDFGNSDNDDETIDANNPEGSAEPLSPEMEEGYNFLRQREYEDALKMFKRAEKKEKANPARAYWGQVRAYNGLGAYKNVVQVCEKLVLATSAPRFQALAHNQRGIALIALADQRDSKPHEKKELPAAEQAFRTTLELEPRLQIARFNLGVTLLKQERDEEGIQLLKNYLEEYPRGASSEEAERFIENPRRAREPFAPEFSAVTSAGEYLGLEDLRGKVVLVDFWATWCPPCVESLPSLKSISKRFSKDPFVLISISVDSDEGPWRQMIAKEKMEWHQVRDKDGELSRLFKIRPIPTYLVIDAEGIIRMRQTGWGMFMGAEIESSIKKNLKALAKMTAKGAS